MFAPAPTNGSQNGAPTSMTTRGRRRQRPLSADNSLPLPKSKRLRSDRPQVTEQTFVDPIAAPENYEVKSAQPSTVGTKQDGIERPVATPRQELSVRSKKSRQGDRLHKGDGTTLLSTNIAFDVRKLPALPERIKLDISSRQHGFVDTSIGFALSLTHTHAVVWPYTAPALSPESFTFTLPYPSKHATDPLPLGLLVSPSASSSEPGLVVVMPTSGKITFWESISSATTLDFMRQQRTGVEDSISGMCSGERVIQLINVEAAAGFILAFSTGRIAYLSVRDAQGRPKVSVQFLRTSLGPSSGGFLGSIRNVLSHSALQGDIAAVRAGRSSKQGECTVVAATSKGRINSWRIHRGGHHDLLAELDVRSAIFDAIRHTDEKSSALASDSFKIIDFCFVPKGMSSKYTEMSKLRQLPPADDRQHLLLLTSLDDKHLCRYSLVEMLIQNGHPQDSPIDIGMVRSISSFTTPPDPHALARPRLYLPKPNVIAFLVFDHATVVASVAQPPETPDSQIMEDNHVLPADFEDIIDLRRDPALEIVGSGSEEPQIYDNEDNEIRPARIKTKNPTAVLLVRGVGIMRVAITDCQRFASMAPPKLTAKIKLEQAVFFGIKDDNPLVFDVQHNIRFSDREYGEAALALSEDILASTGPHLAPLAARLDDNIKDRVRFLHTIMTHINRIGVNLDRSTKWQLIWNAEKMHVAGTLWRKHEEFLHMRPATSKKTIVAEIVEYIRSEEKSKPDRAKGETDELRHWFIHDIHRMELFIAWAYQVIKHNSKAKLDTVSLTRLTYEASDIYNSTIRDAYTFRQAHLELYGLKREKLNHGILEGDYSGLPTPWTANKFVANNVKRQVELVTEWVKHPDESHTEEQKDQITRMRQLLPEMTEIYLSVLQELTRWNLASGDSKLISEGQKYEEVYNEDRHNKVVSLAQSNNWEAAIKIAETHRSLHALAEVLTREIDLLRDELSSSDISPSQAEKIESRMTEKEKKVRDCFDTYGEDFAFPFYDYLFATYGVDALLEYEGDKKYKTIYLRTKPELAKISWINDIVGEEDIDHAANTLLDLGLAREQQVWNKKIELSLGKLARMAECSRPASKASVAIQEVSINGTTEDARVDAIDKELAIINIQDEFYETQIRPVIKVALDEASEPRLVQDAFGLQCPKKYKILAQLFDDAMKRLLKHEALDPLTLIDLLTMVTLPPETKENIADQFFLAIQVASNGLRGDERYQAERLIWRRCFLREDWTSINNTSMKDDEETMDVLGQTDLFQLYCTLYANQNSREAKLAHRRLAPSQAVGVYTDTLDRRFTNMEKGYQEKMLEAMRWEDANLRKHIEQHRLEEWTQETQKLAEQAVDQQYDDVTEAQSTGNLPKTLPARKLWVKSAEVANGRNGAH
ncbi:Non-repetitive/WGA-negative nucleoporin C-terminal-domain-containing protein [Xylaria bambusicola]|uniref:Non-repetitive/WGA-negative nucleoporin C-terminal-domain-containing protein n=1 Tax=Xylaria bambusicola TaxID=326684 RepID=UPI002008D570|nr:Non-repetitive/WGA-negative nucleoporin C-terminal-domain-containing protein [Xylaria bambusicola]KAI0505977.1 Non-repetitive/WGA-negative nucleoporin C-terminal-domain-containing protein [Xylaria bambusicola]